MSVTFPDELLEPNSDDSPFEDGEESEIKESEE